MPLKETFRSKSTAHLYEFAEEVALTPEDAALRISDRQKPGSPPPGTASPAENARGQRR